MIKKKIDYVNYVNYITIVIALTLIIGFILHTHKRDVKQAIIKINNICTGVVISKNYALTASHCVKNLKVIVEKEGFTVKANIVYKNNEEDLVILQGDFSSFNYLRIANKIPEVFEEVASFGIIEDILIITKLFCLDKHEILQKLEFNVFSGLLYPGFSGGPILNKRNEIISLNSQRISNTPLTLGIRLKNIKKAVESLNN